MKRVLIVAGSDSGGGAGIQADVKTVTLLGSHAMTAITAITAQNTLGVRAVHAVPPEMVAAQMRACLEDIGADAVKIGMIGSAEIAHAVADVLEHEARGVPLVFDPVMIATSGAVLADAGTVAAFARLMRRATLVTPNLPELAALEGAGAGAAALRETGTLLLAKGGHGEGATVIDRLLGPDGEIAHWEAPRIATRHMHGTGCTLASGIAEGLARGLPLTDAIARARAFVRAALRAAPGLGGGHGPMGHHRVRIDGIGGTRANQVTLPATDLAASEAFYAALGLTPIVRSGERYARFEGADGNTVSIEAAAEMDGAPVVYLECEDLDAAVEAAAGQGGIVTRGVRDEEWGWREAHVTDPGGNAIRLYQAGEQRRFPPWRLP